MAERALDLMKRRSLSRTAFGKLLAEKVCNLIEKVCDLILSQLLHLLCKSSIPNLQKFCMFVPSTTLSHSAMQGVMQQSFSCTQTLLLGHM